MHPRPPKSAPGRMKSKNSAIKDIEEWVQQDCMLAQEKTRHSGHPPENITEERLLKTRLMELGKERFKVLAKLNSEKQTFIDKQKRKAFLMKRVRDENNIVRNKSRSCSLDQTREQSLEIPTLGNPRDFSRVPRPKTVHFEHQHKANNNLATTLDDIRPHTVAMTPRNLAETLMTTDTSGDFMLVMNPSSKDPLNDMYLIDLSRSSTNVAGFSRSESLLEGGPDNTASNKTIKNRRNAIKPMGITGDPRYANLEASLSDNYIGRCKLDVRTIINRTESLQKQSRVGGKEARRALQEKVRQFMFERDMSFKHMLV